MSEHTTPACACLYVEYDAKHLGSGTYRDRWHCRECKREFVPDAVIDKTQARAEEAERLLEAAAYYAGSWTVEQMDEWQAEVRAFLDRRPEDA